MNREMIESNCLNMQYELLKGMYFDNRKDTDYYLLCSSRVMDDYFWNIAYLKNKFNNELLKQLENKFKNIDRNSSIYIGKTDINNNLNKKLLISNGYKLNNTDVCVY